MEKSKFESILSTTSLEVGFSLSISDNGYFEFTSEKDHVFQAIGGGYQGGFREVKRLGASVFFHDLHRWLHPTEASVNPSDRPVHMKLPIHQSLWDLSKEDGVFKDFPVKINREDDVLTLKGLIERFWREEAKPFFLHWSDIRSFLPFLESSDPSIWVRVLSNFTIESKMIIWKLCDHPGYQDFVEKRKEILNHAISGQPSNKSYLEVLQRVTTMEKHLEELSPIYAWDESYLTPNPFKGILPIIP
ncbi:MAG TPA: hypothetical protein DCE41_26755 [Cytophagales bacterium]|nr:hypothetical protein [Cytophagales bacterium]HAA21880.1 hypothetical protein [Cytophagales bacterium]HAP58265.1 hypothetical protein [Cytophagales bacterium]